jgi:hypothetical protein
MKKSEAQQIAQTIKEQIYSIGMPKVWSWGCSNWGYGIINSTKEAYLILKVNGLKYKGLLRVVCSYDDTYRLELLKRTKTGEFEILQSFDNLSCDNIGEFIDNTIEYTGDNDSYKKSLEAKKLI